jgi:uncharacterized protein YggE
MSINKIITSSAFLILSISTIYFASLAIQKPSHPPIKFPNKTSDSGTINVTGESEIKAIPDSAIVIATIRGSSKQITEAQTSINIRTRALSEELKKLEIDDKDIQSISYQVRPKYEYVKIECNNANCGSKRELTGYEASQVIEIKTQKIELAGKIITMLGKIEINEISGPNFAIYNTKELESKARIAAIGNSKEKAQEIATALGVKLGKVVRFTEDGASGPDFHPKMMFKTLAVSADSQAKLFTGEKTIRSQVNVVYEIE